MSHQAVDGMRWRIMRWRVLAAPRLHASDREPLEYLEFAFTDRVAQSSAL